MDEIWIIICPRATSAGSVDDLGSELFFATSEEAQHHIDTREAWAGMSDRSRYRPYKLRKKG